MTLKNRGFGNIAGEAVARSSTDHGRDDPGTGQRIAELRAQLRAHPCHGCADREQHARWAERYWRLRRETDALRRRVESRTNSIARVFDRVCDLLQHLDYLDGETVTPAGRQLARLYGELDLLAAQCLRSGVWAGLSPPELAACVSALVYEAREPVTAPPRLPRGRAPDVLDTTMRLWGELAAAERDRRLDFLREPAAGFAWAAFRWASGARLDSVLTENAMSAGDFVRWVRQLLDVLGQLGQAADDELRPIVDAAMTALRRGVVAYSSVG